MKRLDPYNDEMMKQLLCQQQRLEWDERSDFPWKRGVDFSRYFVPLDSHNVVFGPLPARQRKALSQYMGLMIASVFSEFEMAINRLQADCWYRFITRHGTHPELIHLGEHFFAEEAKHARVFQRFIDECALELNIDRGDLTDMLPRLRTSAIEKLVKLNAHWGGMSLWWIVASVEEESQLIFRKMKPHQKSLDPLYATIHQKHFEEEARHAPYAFLMLTLGKSNQSTFETLLHKTDVLATDCLKTAWLMWELRHCAVKTKFKNHHPFFRELSLLNDKLANHSGLSLVNTLVTQAPYISDFLNHSQHNEFKRSINETQSWNTTLPDVKHVELSCE